MKIKSGYIVLAILILFPSIVNLLVPLYNKDMPEIFGIPFFYWFQTIWLIICSGFYLAFALLVKKEEEKNASAAEEAAGAASGGGFKLK